jgi:hypothetical protein
MFAFIVRFLLAIMFSQLKAPPSVFREWMLSCDNEYLKDDFVKQLEKYLPTAEELKALAEYKDEINDLQYSEQYFCGVSLSSFVFLFFIFFFSLDR